MVTSLPVGGVTDGVALEMKKGKGRPKGSKNKVKPDGSCSAKSGTASNSQTITFGCAVSYNFDWLLVESNHDWKQMI